MAQEIFQYTDDDVQSMIVGVRGQRVILASDLARLYGVPPKALNQAVKRNARRFPADFVFQLTLEEARELMHSRSQSVTLKRGTNIKYRPYAFTEHGALMTANVLNSPRAAEMSVFVVRAFIKMRETLAGSKTLALKLSELENHLTMRLNIHEKAIVHVLGEIKKLMPPYPEPEKPKRTIGFTAKEKRAAYAVK